MHNRDATRHRGGRVAVVSLNLALGVPAVVPVWLTWFYLTTWPLAALGITTGEPTENDGVVVASVAIIPVVALGLITWFLVGRWVRRRLHVTDAAWFWPVSTAAVLLPSAVLVVASMVGPPR